ncbi:hypothetical protein EJ06DRAFT_249571 [Trichodelitschia bisporula]|uniref:RNA polymerase II degradation factor 1 n=1 Tax=Trichodelitschia bisporula TaxID=703511 RepID=A0A6G1HKD8_9PEZI|nr:hypothetical protein EJ06DRAFT_249571 [Trichodelitschia bisporula]
MSEVTARPAAARGRGGPRGGRGGMRGGTRGRDRHYNGDFKETAPVEDLSDQGEIGEMKKQFAAQLPVLKELFEQWTEVDLLFALQETDGDLDSTIERITEGHIAQFSDVKKAGGRARPKAKDHAEPPRPPRTSRTNTDSARGGRGRGGAQIRGGARPGRGGVHTGTNGVRAPASASSFPEPSAWGASAEPAEPAGADNSAPSAAAPVAKPEVKAPAAAPPAGPPKKTWASIAKPAAPPVIPQAPPKPPVEAPAPVVSEPTASDISSGYVEVSHSDADIEDVAATLVTDDEPVTEPPDVSTTTESAAEEPTIELSPPTDQLTKENVEHLPDSAGPAPLGTAASTVDSSTPSAQGPQTQQTPARPALGGFATSAHKAAGTPSRNPTFQRRLLEQQEAVVMPGNHGLDRATIQFGNMGLNGDSDSLDVDEDREEAETRTQPPQHSPVAQPRASLPPAPRQPSAAAPPAEAPVPETKPAPGLPPAPQQAQPLPQQSPPSTLASQIMAQQGSQGAYGQFSRFGQANLPSETAAQKPFADPFAPQTTQQAPFDSYQAPTAPGQPQPGQSTIGAFSSVANDYSSYYTADQRQAYQNLYNSYGQQQGASAQQDAGAAQQRAGSAFGNASTESSFPTGQAQQPRYAEAQQSGHNTPNQAIATQHPTTQSQQAQHLHQPHGQQYPYTHNPYYNPSYYSAYMNQYQPYGQQNFGTPFNKGMYNQPHHGYGMTSQSSYDQHSSSPAGVGSFGQSSIHNRDAGLGAGLGDYSRTGAAQPSQGQHNSGSNAFGGSVPDVFARNQANFQGQAQPYSQQQSGQQAGNEDSLKPFGEGKAGTGPSPSALGQPGRPGSANPQQAAQSGLPTPQSHQPGGFGAYPNHLGQMQSGQASQFGLGGLGHQTGQQSHQGGGYGGYTGGGGFGTYGSYGRGGGGWGGNYTH